MAIAVVGLVIPHLFDMNEHHAVVYGMLLIFGVLQIGLLILSDKQSQQSEPSPLKEGEFVKLYSEALTGVITSIPLLYALENGKPAFTEQDRKDIIRAILKHVCTIVEAYKSDTQKGKDEINAGWYAPIPEDKATANQKEAAKPFMDPNRSSYKTFLILTDWAYHGEPVRTPRWASRTQPKPCVPEGFVLPVDEEGQYAMFGAPTAFLTGNVQYVNDIKSLVRNDQELATLSGMHNEAVRQGMAAHFGARKSYESFVDVPISWRDRILGVVVIQSKQKSFFNTENRDDRTMLDSMQPFLAILALFVS